MAQAETTQAGPNQAMAIIAGVAGWIVPGLGHLIQRRWRKALAYFVSVAVLAVVGLLMRGNVFSFDGDALDRLGFLADLGTGIFYFLSHTIGAAGPDIAHSWGDYGTRLIATAGVLNLLCVLEAVNIALGQSGERQLA